MLSEGRFNQLFQGQTMTAKKVYNAVPISEPWTTNQIAAEMIRLGYSIDFIVMVGCLNTLIKSKLVQETQMRTYVRTPIRVRAVQQMVTAASSDIDEEDDDMPATQMIATKPKPDATTRLGTIASSIRRMADELQNLANDIDTAAIDAETEIEALKASLERFTQLKTLLKEMT